MSSAAETSVKYEARARSTAFSKSHRSSLAFATAASASAATSFRKTRGACRALDDCSGQGIGPVQISGRFPPVHVVAVVFAELVRQRQVVHHRVALVAGPREKELALGAEVHARFRIVSVVRMRHPDVMTDLMDRGPGESIAELPIDVGVEGEDEGLRPVDPVVVGESQEPELLTESRLSGVEGEYRRDVIARGVDRYVVGETLVEEAEELREGIAECLPASRPAARQREDVEGLLGAGVDRVDVAERRLPAVVGLKSLPDISGEGRVDEVGAARGRIVLEHGDVGDLAAERTRRGDERIVERRWREQQIDGDVAGQQSHVVAERIRRAVAADRVLPDGRHAVLLDAIVIKVPDVHDPVGRVPLGSSREVIEPAPRPGSAPGHDRAALQRPEVEARVGVGLAGPGVGVEREVPTAIPVDEVHRVPVGSWLGVVLQPPFDSRPVDVEDRPCHVHQVVDLIVVGRLVDRRVSRRARPREKAEELIFEAPALAGKRVLERVLETELTAVQPVELGIADHRCRGARQKRGEVRLIDVAAVESDQHDVDRHRLLVSDERAGVEAAERRRAARREVEIRGLRPIRGRAFGDDGCAEREERQGKDRCKQATGHGWLLSATCQGLGRALDTVARRS